MKSTIDLIKEQIQSNPIILYMKGSPMRPACGFSAKAVQLLKQCGANFTHVDILEYPEIRRELPTFSAWPTFPQLYVKGELIGGCDIMISLHESGELKKLLEKN